MSLVNWLTLKTWNKSANFGGRCPFWMTTWSSLWWWPWTCNQKIYHPFITFTEMCQTVFYFSVFQDCLGFFNLPMSGSISKFCAYSRYLTKVVRISKNHTQKWMSLCALKTFCLWACKKLTSSFLSFLNLACEKVMFQVCLACKKWNSFFLNFFYIEKIIN